jgi:DNA-binding transcriptional regulator LsrR (DeoR family)
MMNMMVPESPVEYWTYHSINAWMRLEFASTKEDITTELAVKTATIAAMVHHSKRTGSLRIFIKSEINTGGPKNIDKKSSK